MNAFEPLVLEGIFVRGDARMLLRQRMITTAVETQFRSPSTFARIISMRMLAFRTRTLLAMTTLLVAVGCTMPAATPSSIATAVPASPMSLASGATSTSIPVLTGKPAVMAQEREALLRFIVSELAEGGKMDRYIAQSSRATSPATGPLHKDSASLERCWFSQPGSLSDCNPSEFVDSYQHEPYRAWKHSYVVFGLISVDDSGSQAIIQLDEYFGPLAALGDVITIGRVNSQWRVISRRALWAS